MKMSLLHSSGIILLISFLIPFCVFCETEGEASNVELKQRAINGDVQAQFEVGEQAYEKGSLQDAFDFYAMAAQNGHSTAQFNIGLMYRNGTVVRKNYDEAIKWLSRAAEQGHAKAQYYLGFMYAVGQGVTKDDKEGIKWLNKAAAQGDSEAQSFLGAAHDVDTGVPQDENKAENLLIQNESGLYAKGEEIGRGMSIDSDSFIEDLKKAGNVKIQQELATQDVGDGSGGGNAEAFDSFFEELNHMAEAEDATEKRNLFLEFIYLCIWPTIIGAIYSQSKSHPRKKYLTFWPRFWAPSIDEVVMWPINSLLPLYIYSLFELNLFVEILLSLVITLSYFTYTILCHWAYGATVGKMGCKVKVVDAKTEEMISFKQAFIRDCIPLFLILTMFVYGYWFVDLDTDNIPAALFIVPFVYLFWFLAEVLTMLTNEKRRALHDFIAGTVVIRTDLEG